MGRPAVTLKREASGLTLYAGFSAISLPPQQQRHPQSQHHQSYAINWNTLRVLAQSVQQVDDVDDRSDQEDDPADSELMNVYHTESPVCAVNCNSFYLGISISLDPAAQNANILGPITDKISKCCVNKRYIVRAASATIALLKSVFI